MNLCAYCIKGRNGAACPSYINYRLKSEVSITLRCQPVTQHYESRTIRKPILQSMHVTSKERNGAVHPSYINCCLKSKVCITLRCQLCSTRYTALQIKNCLKSTSAIKVLIEKYGQFPLQREAIMCYYQIDTFPCQ